ncbi:MAG: cupin domain-containing protein [Acidimicrobiales bacterium]|jgi:quercetin dioxygenase-like cupin family protein
MGSSRCCAADRPLATAHQCACKMFLMLAGEAVFWLDDERHELGEGGVIFLPHNVPHAFRVLSENADMRILGPPRTN